MPDKLDVLDHQRRLMVAFRDLQQNPHLETNPGMCLLLAAPHKVDKNELLEFAEYLDSQYTCGNVQPIREIH